MAAALIMSLTGAARQSGITMQPYTNAWQMTFHGDDGTVSPPQLWEDRMDTATWRGRPAMRRVQIEHRLVPAGGYQRWENVFDARTLEPFMSEQRQRNGMFVRQEFDGLRVREFRTLRPPGGLMARGATLDSVSSEYTLRGPFLDFYGGMYATILATRPLAVGASGSFPALVAPDTIVEVPYRVTARDTVRGVGGRPTEAYRVDVGIRSGPGSGGGMFTAWVIARPPYVLRLTTPQASPAGYWSWDETP